MTGNCEDCAKEKDCKQDIGIIWGFCKTDFEPKRKGQENDGKKIKSRTHG